MAVKQQETQINDSIRDPEVRVVGANGEQLGIMTPREANAIAEKEGYIEFFMLNVNLVMCDCSILGFFNFGFTFNVFC